MMTCEKLSEVDAHLESACKKLGLRSPVAVRSSKCDRIEIYIPPGWPADDVSNLVKAMSESLNSGSVKWDVWVATDAANTVCAAEAATHEDSE